MAKKEKQGNKKMVGVWLDMKTFNDLAALAAHKDIKVSNYAVQLVKRGIEQDEEAYENGELEGAGDDEKEETISKSEPKDDDGDDDDEDFDDDNDDDDDDDDDDEGDDEDYEDDKSY
jgi:hypothetical protein